jgi:hypothetical protein
MSLPEDSSAPRPAAADCWRVRHNDLFPREARCLLFAQHSQSLRDCQACRTIAWCEFYDRAGVRQPDRPALEQWEDDGGPVAQPAEKLLICEQLI